MGGSHGPLIPGWKLRPPGLTGSIGEIPVATRLGAALARTPYVSVVAPAGFGKSTALAAWSADERSRRPIWVRLEPRDDDPHVLAALIAASIGRSYGAVPARTERLLASSAACSADQLVAALCLDIEDLDGVVVVLDDLHHLRTTSALDVVERLIDDVGPSCRIITAGREEPPFGMVQRRARRRVVEFGVADLRLDRDQVAGLLAERGVRDGPMTDEILRRSGGWAAAAVLLAAHSTPSAAPGEHRPVVSLLGTDDVATFLRVEVLDRMAPELRDFVLETSILAWLDVDTCAVTTGSDQAVALLDQVRRHGLTERVGAAPTAQSGEILRYHDCFAELLRAELRARRTPMQRLTLHRRAAAVSPPMRAIELLLAVDDLDGAAAAVGRVLVDTPGERIPPSWLAPLGADRIGARPWLATAAGLGAVESGDMVMAMAFLGPAVASMRAAAERAGFVLGAYGLAEANLALGRVDAAATLLDELLGWDTTPDERAKVLMAKVWLDYLRGDWAEVESALDEAVTSALTSCREYGRTAVALGLGTELFFAPRGVAWLADRVAELARRPGEDVMAVTNLVLMGAAADLVRGRIDRAQAAVVSLDERALEIGNLNWLAMAADRVGLGVALALEDTSTVDAIVDEARTRLGASDRHHQERAMYAYALARSGPPAGRHERVRAARVPLGAVSAVDRPDTAVTAAVLDSLHHRHEGDLEAAEAALVAVGDLHHRARFCLLTGLVDLELAAIRLASGRVRAAIETARPTLRQLAAWEGIGLLSMDGRDTHRPVLEACREDPEVGAFARRALRSLTAPVAASGLVVPETGERLTARELEVMHLVIGGASNRAIATRLTIGERTVKSHMTSLMRKLGVGSRTAAIARCRELGVG